jgi:hypothetical protein
MWQEAMPDFSWNSVRFFPVRVKRCFDYRLDSIDNRLDKNHFTAYLAPKGESKPGALDWDLWPCYRVERQQGGWKATPAFRIIL